MPIEPSLAASETAWSGNGPDPDSTLHVRRQTSGLWHVTYEGLVWATSDSLRAALGNACGIAKNEPWTIATEEEILRETS